MTSAERVRSFHVQCRRTLREGAGCLVIDLGNVMHADTKLVACLVDVYRLARASSVRVEMPLSKTVMELLQICKLQPLVERTTVKSETALKA